jgi:hypothetical protein
LLVNQKQQIIQDELTKSFFEEFKDSFDCTEDLRFLFIFENNVIIVKIIQIFKGFQGFHKINFIFFFFDWGGCGESSKKAFA